MPEKIEKLIKVVYRKWKAGMPGAFHSHPLEETFASFLDGRLSQEEARALRDHLISCRNCAEAIEVQLKLNKVDLTDIPVELQSWARNLVASADKSSFLEIILRLKGKLWEVLSTSGDILLGQELVPAPVLRSRQKENLKDEVTILKDFQDIRVEVKIENRGERVFDLTIMAREKQTQLPVKDLRFTLIRDELELESYYTDLGKITFEHVLLGRYVVEVSSLGDKLASILLDIKV